MTERKKTALGDWYENSTLLFQSGGKLISEFGLRGFGFRS